jgi:hypothetical protein
MRRLKTDELDFALAGCKKKIYRIKEIATGEIKEFRCPKEIIDRYKTNHANLADLFNKKQNTVKGICLPETNPEIRKNGGGLKTVVDQYGTIYEFYNPNKFCRENQCGKETIRRLIKGVCLTVKSKDGRIFRLENTILNSMEYLRSIKLMNVNQKYKQIILTRISDNKDFTINMPDYIKEFCKNNDIYKREIYALTNKEQKTAKGFKLKEVIYLYKLITENLSTNFEYKAKHETCSHIQTVSLLFQKLGYHVSLHEENDLYHIKIKLF